MKTQLKHLLFSTSLLSILFLTLGAYASNEIPLNHCSPITGSKRYIDSDFSTNYPRRVKFECAYECQLKEGLEQVLAVKDVMIRNSEDDARMTACQGVQVKKVSWGWDFDKIVPFYAYDSNMPDMKEFAFSRINQKNETERNYLIKLKKTLKQVSTSFKVTGVKHFQEAGLRLEKIADELPLKTIELDRAIDEIINFKGRLPSAMDSQGLVLININSHAAWRIPSHLF